LLAEDFFEFGRSGRVWYRKDTIATVPQKKDTVFPLPELLKLSQSWEKIILLSSDDDVKAFNKFFVLFEEFVKREDK
jgi:hypothetical protein